MSIKWKMKPAPEEFDNREVTKFLLFPKCLDGEYRWLGRERIVQVYRSVRCLSPSSAPFGFEIEKWVDVRWAK